MDEAERRGPGRPPMGEAGERTTHDEILRHAERLFEERGYRDVAMGDIAAAVGVTKPSLYYHFTHKEALYTAVLIETMTRIGSWITAMLEQNSDLAERLHWLAHHALIHAPRGGGIGALLRDGEIHLVAVDWARIKAAHDQQMMDPLRAVMRAGIAEGALRVQDPEFLVRTWFGILEAFIGGKVEDDTPLMADRLALARHITDLFLHGAGNADRGNWEPATIV